MTGALEGGEWSAARPGRNLPPGKTRYPLYMRLGGPQGRSGRAENLVPTGIRSRTVQPVVAIPTELPGLNESVEYLHRIIYRYSAPTSQSAHIVLITETSLSVLYMGGPCALGGHVVTHMLLVCCVGSSHSCDILQQVVNIASN